MSKDKMKYPNIAPDSIETLKRNEIFVFGSDFTGQHNGGAASVAFQRFGAKWGVGVGLAGQSYAIPTTQGGIETIRPYVEQFIQFAKSHREYDFLVTRIGCGTAGFEAEEIAPLFEEAIDVDNIYLPQNFLEIIIRKNIIKERMIKYINSIKIGSTNKPKMHRNPMLMGAIIGDIAGSIYEFWPHKSTDINLMDDEMEYTDDSIMTVAVADWLMGERVSEARLVAQMQKWGRKYPTPMGAYGGMFSRWLISDTPKPYNSFGNGSAMRVSAAGFAGYSLENTLEIAKVTAEVTHNHPEGIKGAQATAAAIYLARTGSTKDGIRQYITRKFGYNLNRTCDEIRPTYGFDGSCQGTVPESIIAFLESKDYEDALRLCISLGGDADTMGAITGAIAGAYYKEIPETLYQFGWNKLPLDIQIVVKEFDSMFGGR